MCFYAHSYASAGHPASSEYTEKTMLPTIKEMVLDKYDLHFNIYGMDLFIGLLFFQLTKSRFNGFMFGTIRIIKVQ